MRIPDTRPNFDKPVAGGAESTRAGDAKAVDKNTRSTDAKAVDAPVAPAKADEVHVSARAQFASAAIEAAQTTPEIRAEAVERAKALVASGKLGADAHRLADKLIDSLLDS